MNMATALIANESAGCTLYELEDNLQALVNSIDLAQEPAIREFILEKIGQEVRRVKEKRDSVVAFLRHCKSQQEFADAEIERIQKRRAFIARVQEELESCLIPVVEQYAKPDRRGIQRLDGNFSSLRIRRNPESVLVSDIEACVCRSLDAKRLCADSGRTRPRGLPARPPSSLRAAFRAH